MAVLQRIRNHSVALLVIVGFAMAAFIVGDLLTSSSSIMQSNRDKVVTINGKKVTYEQFETSRQRKTEFFKSMMGQELDNNASQQLTQTVYNEFIAKNLLNEVCGKLGISVPADEINELVQGEHISPVLGQYFGDQAPSIAQFFTNLVVNDAFEEAEMQYPFATRNNWMEIEEEIVLARLMDKYEGLVAAAIQPNKLEALDNFNGDNTECSFAYVKQYASVVADSLVKVDQKDVAKYYESAKRQYKLNADLRTVDYINVALRPSELDYAEAEANIKAIRDEFATTSDVETLVNGNSLASYMDAWVPVSGFEGETLEFVEQNEVGAILEPHRANGDYYMMARIMDKTVGADSIELAITFVPAEQADSISKVLADATDATVALASISDQNKYVGWMQDPQLLQSFGDELRNKIRSAVKGSTFTHDLNEQVKAICKVTNKTAPVALAKVAVYATEVIPSSRTRSEEYGKLNRFLTAHKSVKEMQDSARAAGFNMLSATLRSDAYNVATLQDARQAVKFAFQNKKGAVSEIYETAGNNLLVVAITGDIQKGYQSLNDSNLCKQISMFNVLPMKKIEKLEADFAAVADKTLAGYSAAFGGAAIDTAKFVNYNLNNVMGLGAEPKIFKAALNANVGDVITVAGRNVVVALQLLSKNEKGLTYDEQARIQAVARGREYAQAAQSALQALQGSAKIEDNRINFY